MMCTLNQFGSDSDIWNVEKEVYDMGWLDRIGYISSVGVNVQVKEYGPLPIVVSDHLPVLMKCEVR